MQSSCSVHAEHRGLTVVANYESGLGMEIAVYSGGGFDSIASISRGGHGQVRATVKKINISPAVFIGMNGTNESSLFPAE